MSSPPPASAAATAETLDELFAAVADGDAARVAAVLVRQPSDAARMALLAASPAAAGEQQHGWTPLHVAARYGAADVAAALVAAGASPASRSARGQTPVDVALQWGHDACATAMGWTPPTSSSSSTPAGTTAAGAAAVPALPPPAVATVAGNFFTGSPLDRRSELREDAAGVRAAGLAAARGPRFMALGRLRPLVRASTGNPTATTTATSAAWPGATTASAIAWLGLDDLVAAGVSTTTLAELVDPAAADSPILVLLGFDEADVPHWVLDVTNLPAVSAALESTSGLSFVDPRPAAFAMPPRDAAIFSHARAMVDWNARNSFCSMCGARTVSRHAGYKRGCPATGCLSKAGVQNVSYPRTDTVVIVCIVHPDGERILLGRKKAFPPHFYSCVAGFIEPGESLEEATHREAREETSVRLNPARVAYHSSQPWPFPAQLMVGMVAEAVTDEVRPVDGELEDARWFSREEVLAALADGAPADGKTAPAPADPLFRPQAAGARLRLPGTVAIARTLIQAWADGSVKFPTAVAAPVPIAGASGRPRM